MRYPLVSIIIPAYNCAPYIQECIQSVQNQSYSHIEIIVVNDGSTDDTDSLLEPLVQKDQRIKYIRKQNGGVSTARNCGMNVATGKLCCFVDADDQVGAKYIETLVSTMGDSDLTVVLNHQNKHQLLTKTLQQKEIFRSLILNKDVSGVPWNKLFHMDIIKKYDIHFDENIKVCEDLLFNIEYAMHVDSAIMVMDCNESMYMYNRREGSALHIKDERIIKDSLQSYKIILDKYRNYIDKECVKKIQHDYSGSALRCILFHTYRTQKIDKEFIKRYLSYAGAYELDSDLKKLYLILKYAPNLFLQVYLIKKHRKLLR